ncbi:MAG: hypothetical protein JWQ21_738 [Herminiimonas sp.]|nr:hypothetical protein [Herminiimonas sp.]
MRADSALSHLYDGEICIAEMRDGTKHQVRWSRQDWCFFYIDTRMPAVCRFDDIKEWRPASIKF